MFRRDRSDLNDYVALLHSKESRTNDRTTDREGLSLPGRSGWLAGKKKYLDVDDETVGLNQGESSVKIKLV